MITPTTSPALFVGSSANGTPRNDGLGADEFLRLLVTQLKNQDPLNPLQAHEFAAQLAQFASVEQLTQLNASVLEQSDLLNLSVLLNKTSFSAALIGREVVASGNEVDVPTTGTGSVRFEVGPGGGRGTLTLLDDDGHEVASRDLGPLPAGRQTIDLPAGLPAGHYHYELKVKDSQDKVVPVTTYSTGVVTGVSFENGRIVIHAGAMRMFMEDIAEITSTNRGSADVSNVPPPDWEPFPRPIYPMEGFRS